VGTRADLDTVEQKNSQPPPGIEPRSSDRPARSQSPYRLSYPGSSLLLEYYSIIADTVRCTVLSNRKKLIALGFGWLGIGTSGGLS
jgi:hypothetical protein